MKDYESIRKWFSSKSYEATTESVYLKYMAIMCGLLHKTPDQLANVNSKEALELQVELVGAMKGELKLTNRSITQRINALHSFWRANNVQLTEGIMRYEGTPHLRRVIKAKKRR
ncbi:MAG: hypothetical protein NWE84_09315 [Candidatus Bathyarchaeota archaeon]|nr:hypothetical protein [Candidatus Bathyarchaeota archaeon]